ncbi:putative Mitochondrial glycoprotein [Trypanosoma vivax]|uniref:Putative p22 protein n=1 Tax=Trypanosoma vivax (strain Y486) TaxID=1055687 RepID=G0TWR1_TRYVY|nr:putative p22 protein precursor [Trypanosoma vivax]KAH8613553.1 putative Mitochondrial glycoprotein [Trypanosoma vivax]CCC48399.1 putative p22 protein precursor [Trypanosoma vivax Y486]
MRRALLCVSRGVHATPMMAGRFAALASMVGRPEVSWTHASVLQQRFASCAALANYIRTEIEDEKERAEKPVKPEIPSGWTVEHEPGNMFFKLCKTYEDEEIVLHFKGTREAEGDIFYDFKVFVVNGEKGVMFDLSYDHEIVVDRVIFLRDAKVAIKQSALGQPHDPFIYPGPKMEDMEDNVVEAFIRYLEARGVNDELGDFVLHYACWAEQVEYEQWLSDIHKFVA